MKIPIEFSDNRELVLALIKTGFSLKKASERLRDDEEVVFAAVEKSHRGEAFKHASERLKNDVAMVKRVHARFAHAINYSGSSIWEDEDILSLVATLPCDYLEEPMLHNKRVALVYIQGYGRLRSCSEEIKKDFDVALAALLHCRDNYPDINSKLRNDHAFRLAAVKKNGKLLETFYPWPHNVPVPPDIAMAALENYGCALKCLPKYKEDISFVLPAVKNDGNALGYASNDLRRDFDVVLAAVRNCGGSLRYAGEKLQGNPVILAAACKEHMRIPCQNVRRICEKVEKLWNDWYQPVEPMPFSVITLVVTEDVLAHMFSLVQSSSCSP